MSCACLLNRSGEIPFAGSIPALTALSFNGEFIMQIKAFQFHHEWGDIYIVFASSEEEAWNYVDNYIPGLSKPERYRWRLVKEFDVSGIHRVYKESDSKFY